VSLLGGGDALTFEVTRFWLDGLSADGSADAYTREMHRRLLHLVGIGLLLLGGILLTVRRGAGERVESLAASTVGLWRDLRGLPRRLAQKERLTHWIVLAAIILTGVALRVVQLGSPMRYDESVSFLHYARYPLSLALTTYDAPNNHLFHTLLMHVSYRLFGNAPWALRLPAFVAGTLILPVGYLVARRFVGGAAALVATAMMATSMVTIEMSTNARGYPIVTLVFLLLLGLGQYLRRRDSAAGWMLFAALGAIGLYAIPTMVYGLATVAMWLLLSALVRDISIGRRAFVGRLAAAVVGAGVAASVLYSVLLLQSDLSQILASPMVASKVRPLPLDVFVEGLRVKAVDVWHRWTGDWPFALRVIAVVGFLVVVGRHTRLSAGRVPLWLAAACAIVPLLFLQRVVPFSRIWSFLFPWFCFTAAGGLLYVLRHVPRLDRVRAGHLTVALALGLLAWQTATFPSRSAQYVYGMASFPDAESLVKVIKLHFGPHTRTLVVGSSIIPFWYYCVRHGLPYIDEGLDYRSADWGELPDRQRLFVVVNGQGPPVNDVGQTLEGVLATAMSTRVGRARLLTWHGTGSVYVIDGPPANKPVP
jgi:uncharacterized membrane protein YhdT